MPLSVQRFSWVSLSCHPHRDGEDARAELQQRLHFSFVISQWGCCCLLYTPWYTSWSEVGSLEWIKHYRDKLFLPFVRFSFVICKFVFRILLKKNEKKNPFCVTLGRKIRTEKKSSRRQMIICFNAVHKVHIIQTTYFFGKKNRAALIFLDLSPGRKPSVKKYLWKRCFVVSELLLLFWIPFQETLNLFSSPDLLCHSPFHLCRLG